MTVRLITTIHVYSARSTDVKPTVGVKEDSILTEEDGTGRTFRFKSGAWEENKGATLSAGQYQAGNAELRRLMEQVLLEVQAANLTNGIAAR